ncbi:hypothetical protein SAMN05421692_0754 [Chryseobacterium indologenes]|nr:hypothetical protein CIN01S_10_00880 [Chryseobacterium indologenes NBRC 14944]SFI82301.1 hypothetical protein SAMN05421692_0754 [Chryseobacterium indologenes]SUX50044.1 Uncharacterised protein [Chryseobacterium indologenes]
MRLRKPGKQIVVVNFALKKCEKTKKQRVKVKGKMANMRKKKLADSLFCSLVLSRKNYYI